MYKVVLIRHGESVWNRDNIFTGWTDVDLSDKGKVEAVEAGKLLKAEGFKFDKAYTSVLRRAIKTLWYILEEMNLEWIPTEKSWKLNERHYGALQGLDKAETAKKHGDDQVLLWRRSFDSRPPKVDRDDERFPGNDPRYASIDKEILPVTECLEDTIARVIPFWKESIVPEIKAGKQIIIAAHGNSLRAMVKYLDNISDKDILKLNIPTGVPLVYELDENLKPISRKYLGDPAAVANVPIDVAD